MSELHLQIKLDISVRCPVRFTIVAAALCHQAISTRCDDEAMPHMRQLGEELLCLCLLRCQSGLQMQQGAVDALAPITMPDVHSCRTKTSILPRMGVPICGGPVTFQPR